ncbi:Hypothetical predicted protein [Octopus vulgaris]|uniref:Uncharacterized protein n=1 Tax=Octopus vulgaris TaxID=6645 RepID=A0AA36AJT9_OCTVU|nr:Hypothetical predicted protein [Octopus vulgaris]
MIHNEDYAIIKHIGEYHHSSCASKPKVRKTLADLKAQAAASQESSCSLIATACEKLGENEMAPMPSSSCGEIVIHFIPYQQNCAVTDTGFSCFCGYKEEKICAWDGIDPDAQHQAESKDFIC